MPASADSNHTDTPVECSTTHTAPDQEPLPTEKKLSTLGALAGVVTSARYALVDAAHKAPRALLSYIVMHLLVAAAPALQVIVLAQVVGHADGGRITAPWLIALVLVTGGFIPLRNILYATTLNLQLALRYCYMQEILDMFAGLTPAQRRDKKLGERLQAAHEAIPFNLSWQATSVLQILSSAAAAGMLFVTLADYDALAALLIVAALIPQLIAYTWVAKIVNINWPKEAEVQRRAEYLHNQVRYARPGTELWLLGGSDWVRGRTSGLFQRLLRLWKIGLEIRLRAALFSGLAATLLVAGALMSMSWRTHIEPAVLAAAVMGMVSALLATQETGTAYGEAMASAPIVNQFMGLRHDLEKQAATAGALPAGVQIHPAPDLHDAPVAAAPILELKGVTCEYTPGTPVLSDTDLVVPAGQITALVGPNGAGKTTAVRLFTGQLTPTSGQVTRLPAEQMSVMAQDVEKFELTIREFLELGSADPLPEQTLWDALEKVQLGGYVRGLDEGLDAQLGEQWDGVNLSGGQWQRLAIARAVASPAPLIILDEPTSAVDAKSEEHLFHMLRDLTPGKSIVLVSHRAWTLKYADLIYLIDDGHAVEHGTFAELNQPGRRFHDLFKSQDWS